jgi:hypothetical protein
MKKDPGETINLVTSNPQKVEEMKALLAKCLESFPNRPYGEFVKK